MRATEHLINLPWQNYSLDSGAAKTTHIKIPEKAYRSATLLKSERKKKYGPIIIVE